MYNDTWQTSCSQPLCFVVVCCEFSKIVFSTMKPANMFSVAYVLDNTGSIVLDVDWDQCLRHSL